MSLSAVFCGARSAMTKYLTICVDTAPNPFAPRQRVSLGSRQVNTGYSPELGANPQVRRPRGVAHGFQGRRSRLWWDQRQRLTRMRGTRATRRPVILGFHSTERGRNSAYNASICVKKRPVNKQTTLRVRPKKLSLCPQRASRDRVSNDLAERVRIVHRPAMVPRLQRQQWKDQLRETIAFL
jgi:hypothetical protein